MAKFQGDFLRFQTTSLNSQASSLLDRIGHFDVPIFDAKAQVLDSRSLILRSLLLKSRSSISVLRYPSFDAEAPALNIRSSMLKWLYLKKLLDAQKNLTKF